MALQHLRSSTADKRPTPGAMSDGQLALNTNLASPGLFFKDSNGDTVKIGPVHVGTTAPNVSPAVGGEAGNSLGEAWLDTTAANPILKVWNGSAFVAVQPVGTGTVVSTTDTGTVTSTMILDGTILNADVNASAAIAGTKISPDFGSQNAVTTGTSTAASFIPTSSTVPTNGVYLPAANNVAISTNGTGRVFVDSAGKLLVGTSTSQGKFYNGTSSNHALQVEGSYLMQSWVSNTADSSPAFLTLAKSRGSTPGSVTAVNSGDSLGLLSFQGSDGSEFVECAQIKAQVDGTPGANDMPGRLVFSTTADGAATPTERLRITSAGLVGIGTASPGTLLDLVSSSDASITLTRTAAANAKITTTSNGALAFSLDTSGGNTERARIDSSGRLLVGTSTARVAGQDLVPYAANAGDITLERADVAGLNIISNRSDYIGAALRFGKSTGNAVGSNAIVANDNRLGMIQFCGADGTDMASVGAQIEALVDGTPGADDMPGRLVFSTTADGASSPTERLRITSAGLVGIGTTSPGVKVDIVSGNNTSLASVLRVNSNNVAVNTSLAYDGLIGSGELTVRAGASAALILGSSATERARFDSSGRLLVGTSSSTQTDATVTGQVQIQSSANQRGLSQLHTANDASAALLQFSKIRGSSVVQNADFLGRIQFNGYDGSAYKPAATIDALVDGTPGTNDMPGRLVFSTTADGASTPTERMRIRSNGEIQFGSGGGASPSLGFYPDSAGGYFLKDTNSTNSRTHFYFQINGATVGTITTSGSATAYNTSSDYRLKENVTAVTDGIGRLQQLNPSRFNFIVDPDKTVDGFLAHEVQTVVPEAITGEKDAVDADGNPVYQGIDQSKLVPLLTAALQEAVAKIESLEARLTAAGI